jgi:AraC-like DNA-binding protein
MKNSNTSDNQGLEMKYVMVIETSDYLHRLEANQLNLFTQKLHNGISKLLKKFDGQILQHNDNTYIVLFDSVTNAILCALKVKSNFKYITLKFDKSIRHLKIGIAPHINRVNAQTLATRMCEVVKDQIVITSDVKIAYEKENRNTFINKEHIRTLNSTEEQFLTNLMNYVETIWNNSDFSVVDFSKPLKYSKSQVYRKMISLTGKPPSSFMRDFRLNRAMHLMYDHKGNITEIAQQTGFKIPSYFSKCFKDKFQILPSKYMQQHA